MFVCLLPPQSKWIKIQYIYCGERN
jgi:hypothetical protein